MERLMHSDWGIRFGMCSNWWTFKRMINDEQCPIVKQRKK